MSNDLLVTNTFFSSAVVNKELSPPSISPESIARRNDRYLLLEGLQEHTTKYRLFCCGRYKISPTAMPGVKLDQDTGSSYITQVKRCGYAQFCPVCSAKIGNVRAGEINKAVERALELGHGIYMATLTVPHGPKHTLNELRTVQKGAFQAVASGRRWQADRADFGILGQIRTEESTVGLNGWHPHQHLLFFTDKPLDNYEALQDRIFERWSNYVVSEGYDRPDRQRNKIVEIKEQKGVGRYLSKMGSELARPDLKVAKKKNWNHWQLAWGAVATNDPDLWDKWFEWEREMKGVQLNRWSNGLKSYFDVNVLTDEEIAEQEERFTYYRLFSVSEWETLSEDPALIRRLLSVASTHGSHGVDSFFDWLAEQCAVPA
jgi:hypothetical protein